MMTVIELNSNNLWLEISEGIQQQTWQESNSLTTQGDRRRAYLNLLCQKVILPYILLECPSAKLEKNQTEFWQLGVNGTIINIEDRRLMIIPSETFDLDEFRIPQEWIDIPELAADYYLAAQIDTEEGIIRLWGYTTHKTLKERGSYSRRDRSYFLERNDVTEDINSLWLIRKYFPDEPTRLSIESLPQLSLDNLDRLLDNLGNREVIFPRRAVSFEEWGVIFANHNWRKMLIERRTSQPQTELKSVNLSQWLKNAFEEGWQTIDNLLTTQQAGLAFSRNINITRGREIDLGIQLEKQSVALIVKLDSENEEEVNILIQVHSREQRHLPEGVQLIIGDESKETVLDATSREEDNWIQLKLSAELGEKFYVTVAYKETKVTQEFVF